MCAQSLKPSILARLTLATRAWIEAYRGSAESRDDIAEHPMLRRSRGFIRSPYAAWLIAFGGTAIGIWLALRVDEIRSATGQAWGNLRDLQVGQPLWGEIAFWIACLLWASLLMWRLSDDDEVVLERTGSLLHAIHKVPNIKVVKD